MPELRDKQRLAFEELLKIKIPELLEEKSFIHEGRYKITFSMYPVDVSNPVEDKKDNSVYVIIKVKCLIEDLVTKETQEFYIDILNLPVYQELGFKVGGNYKQVLGLYERPAGWTFLRKVSKGKPPLVSVSIHSENNNIWSFKTVGNNMPVISPARRKDVDDKTDSIYLSVSSFFRAITGYSNEELLELFGYDNPINLLAFNDDDNALRELKGSASKDNSVANRNDCIKLLAKVIFGKKVVNDTNNSVATLENKIQTHLFNENYFSLGEGNSTQLEFKQSFKNRATNKILAKDLELLDTVIPEGTILSAELLEQIDNSPISILHVNYGGKIHTLRKFSCFTFRALGYYLCEDIAEVNLQKGHKLTLDDLRELNKTNLDHLEVSKDEKGLDRVGFSRRVRPKALSVEDLFTAYSIFANNLNGFDTFDKEYELTNRIVIPFDQKALSFIEKHLNEVIRTIREGIRYIEMSVEDSNDRLPLLNIAEKFDFRFVLDDLIKVIKNTDDTESQMSDINNVMSFVSKGYKVSADIGDNNTTDDLIRIQDTQIGRLDLYDAPESKKIGRVHHKTLLAEENEHGFITTPFFRVNNGVVSDEPVRITAAEEENVYVASWDETFMEEDGTPKKKVLARYNGEVVSVDVASVTLKEYSFLQNEGPTTSSIPFINHSNGKRLTMSCNQQKQAVPTVKAKRARVNTGAESFLNIGRYTAKDIINSYYISNVKKFPLLQEYKSDIYNSSIKIASVDTASNGDKIFSFTIDKIEELKKDNINLTILSLAQLQVPYNYRTTDSGLFTYKVNTKQSIYRGNDVVLYSSDYDIEKHNMELLTDFGGQKFDDSVFDTGTALGRDYIIGYKTHGGSTIDDALVINQDLVSDDMLTSILLQCVEEPLYSDDNKKEEFCNNPAGPDYFNAQGLPKIGTNLNPGDPVIMKLVKRTEQIEQINNAEYKATYLNAHTWGQVTSARIYVKNGREIASVILASRADAQVGDKLAGRYGNKGVIAKIVPAEMMPYDPKSGRALDIILDPEGIPSRMNISQLLEGSLGLSCTKQDKHAVVSQYNPDGEDYVRRMADSTDTHPIMLIDPRTGHYFERPVNVVSLYMYKLVHMSRKKIHSIGMQASIDGVTLQPKRGGKFNGGQTFGEMESWCLEGLGAYKVLQELQSTLSDDVKTKKATKHKMTKTHGELTCSGNNNNDLMFQALVRSMCAECITNKDPVTGEQFYEFKPLTDMEIKSLASVPIKTEQALHSIDSFGHVRSAEEKAENKSRWGYIDLGTEMVSPLWLEKSSLHKLFLTKTGERDTSVHICSSSFFKGLIEREQYVKLHSHMRYFEIVSKENISRLDAEESAKFSTGFDALFYILKNYDLQGSYELLCEKAKTYEQQQIWKTGKKKGPTLQDYLKQEFDITSNTAPTVPKDITAVDYDRDTYIEYIQTIRFVKDFLDRGASLEDYIITAFPVMSAVFRPQIKMPGVNAKADFDHYYVQILNAVKSIAYDRNDVSLLNLYRALELFMGFRKEASAKYMNLANWFLGTDKEKSHGKIRETVQSKVILRSGRAVIIPAADTDMDAMHIGIPITAAVVTWEDQIITYLCTKKQEESEVPRAKWRPILYALANRSYGMFKRAYTAEFQNAFLLSPTIAYRDFYKYIKEFLEGKEPDATDADGLPTQVVIAGRQPSLHQFSVRGFYVKTVEDRAIHVNPLVCKGYNADFDGDQMWYCAPISMDAKQEAIEKMSAASNLINPKNGSIILELSQDMALGIYCATMLKNNKEELTDEEKKQAPLSYANIEDLRSDVYAGVISTYTVVSLRYGYNQFLSTAGRILFNTLLPHGLDGINLDGTRRNFSNPLGLVVEKPNRFVDLQFDGLITAGEGVSDKLVTHNLQAITETIYEEYDNNDSLHVDMIRTLQELGKFGFTFSDMFGISIALEDLDEIAASSDKDTQLANMRTIQNAIEEDYQMGLFSDEDKRMAIDGLARETMGNIQGGLFKSMNRNNNIFIMFDSGARGSKSQIAQTCGAIGMLDKTEGQTLETPLVSNYHEGMSSFDVQMMSYSARMGMSSTQNKTADAGYATRQSIYMASGLKIVEWDCGKENWWFDVMWDTMIPEYSKLTPNYEFFKRNLLGKKILSTSKDTLNLFGDSLDNMTITERSFDKLKDGFHSILLEGTEIQEVSLEQVGKYIGYRIAECDSTAPNSGYVDTQLINNLGSVKYLTVYKPIEITVSPELIIGCSIVDDEKASREFKMFMSKGKLTKKCVSVVYHKHILSVNTDIGLFTFRYKMTSACRSLLENREAKNLKYLNIVYDRDHLKEPTFIISDKTLDYVEESGIERIEARIMLDCLSGREESKHGKASHGCCARCFGLKYTNRKFPKIGEIVGIEAAQAVGEPAAQLTLSLVNKGGAAGQSVASGVEIFQSLLSGSVPDAKNNSTLVTNNSGYLVIDNLDDASVVKIIPADRDNILCKKCMKDNNGYCPNDGGENGACLLSKKVLSTRLLYEHGTYLKAGEQLTDGYVLPNAIKRVDPDSLEELVRRKQMVWLLNYYNTFYSNNIYINARHFEIFARIQNFMVLVVKSDNPEFEEGRLYEYSEIVGHEDELTVILNTSKQIDVITQNSGALTALAFESVPEVLSKFAVSGFKSYRNSPVGALNVGQNLTTNKKKVLRSPYMYLKAEEERLEDIYGNENIDFVEEVSEAVSIELDTLDLNSILSADLGTVNNDSYSIEFNLADETGVFITEQIKVKLEGMNNYSSISDIYGQANFSEVVEGDYAVQVISSKWKLKDSDYKVSVTRNGNLGVISLEPVNTQTTEIVLDSMELFNAEVVNDEIEKPENLVQNSYNEVDADDVVGDDSITDEVVDYYEDEDIFDSFESEDIEGALNKPSDSTLNSMSFF